MKFFKTLLVILFAILLTGCYTQLQYSRGMNEVADERNYDRGANQTRDAQITQAEYEEDYIPVYYKDYEYAEFWDECGCNPYVEYNFYNSGFGYYPYSYSWNRPYYYGSYYDWNPFWPWSHHRHFRSTFAFSFHWGSPYYHSFFYSPFYYSYYGFRPLAYNYFYFYNPGSFYYGRNNNVIRDNNRRYGPRSVGTNRVRSDASRSRVRSRSAARNRVESARSRSTVRTRSAGTSRARSTVNRSRTRSSSVGSSRGNVNSSRSRSRGNIQQRINSRIERSDNSRQRSIQRGQNQRQRSSSSIRYRDIDSNDFGIKQVDRSAIQNRLRSQMAPEVDRNRSRSRRSTQPSFFNRLKGFFDSNISIDRISNRSHSRSSGRSIRTRSSSPSRPKIHRSNNSRSRSSVSRSRSSSNDSRSRSTSSRSRSRGNN